MTKVSSCLARLAVASCVGLFLFSGCGAGGDEGPARYKVTGRVTLDGKPLETGRINFLGGEGGGDGGEINNGSYSLQATEGNKRVEITATRVSDKSVEGKSDVNETESLIPETYNSKSTLTAEISSDEPNEFSFDLKSAP